MTPTQGERIAALERGLSDHESRCEERLGEIKASVSATALKIDKLQWWIVAQLVSLVAGLAGLVLHAYHVV